MMVAKILLTLLIVLYPVWLTAGSAQIRTVIGMAISGGAPTLSFHETFETNPGSDNVWTTVSGTPNYDFDANSVGLTGSYCMELADVGGNERVTFAIGSPADEEWKAFEFRLSDGHPASDLSFVYGLGGTTLFYIRVRSDGRMRLEPTGGTSGYIKDAGGVSDVTLPDGDTGVFYLKIRYKKGTGADAIVQVWYSSTGTWGSSGILSSTGTTTAQMDEVGIYNLQADVLTIYTDEVKVDDEDISDY